jgi:vacuolar protein sorting-associated protein 54
MRKERVQTNDCEQKNTVYIPQIYFQRILNLKDPQTFDRITNSANEEHLSLVRKSITCRLNSYLDHIEMRLWGTICKKFTFFFTTINKLSLLNNKVSYLSEYVSIVQTQLKVLKNETVKLSLKFIVLMRRSGRQNILRCILSTAITAQISLRYIREQFSKSDFVGVIKLSNKLNVKIKLLENMSVLCVKPTNRRLKDIHRLAEQSISRRFEHYALLMSNGTVKLGNPGQKIATLLSDVTSAKTLFAIVRRYRDRLIEELRNIILSANSMYSADNSRITKERNPKRNCNTVNSQNHLRRLNCEQFLSLFCLLLEQLSALVFRADEVIRVIRNHVDVVCNTSNSNCRVETDIEQKQVLQFIDNLLFFVCESAHKHVYEILKARRHEHMNLTLQEMKKLWQTSISFSDVCKNKIGKHIKLTENILIDQTRGLLERMKEKHVDQLLNILDSEKWRCCEVPDSIQRILTDIANNNISSCLASATGPEGGATSVVFGGSSYHLVSSAIVLFRFIAKHLAFIHSFPMLVNEVQQAIILMCQTYNQRSHQLVLAGGSFSSGTVKSITVKHLALISQSLGLVIALLPYIRDIMIQRVPLRHTFFLRDIDNMCSSLQDHREAVFCKLAGIVILRLNIASGKLIPADYAKETSPSTVSPYMKSVTYDLKTMHRVLQPILTHAQMTDIFSRILGKFSVYIFLHFLSCTNFKLVVDRFSEHMSTSYLRKFGFKIRNKAEASPCRYRGFVSMLQKYAWV